jgi:hypothetical protein
MHCVMSIGRRVRACTRLLKTAKALATRDHVRGISRLLALSNRLQLCNSIKASSIVLILVTIQAKREDLIRLIVWINVLGNVQLPRGCLQLDINEAAIRAIRSFLVSSLV